MLEPATCGAASAGQRGDLDGRRGAMPAAGSFLTRAGHS